MVKDQERTWAFDSELLFDEVLALKVKQAKWVFLPRAGVDNQSLAAFGSVFSICGRFLILFTHSFIQL